MRLLGKVRNKNQSNVNFVVVGGLLTALTVIIQSAPVFIPMIGMILSPFSTLPVALAAMTRISLGLAVYLASALILIFLSLEEAIIFVFTTGILGLVLGMLIFRKGIVIATVISGVVLSLGITILTFVIGLFKIDGLINSGSAFTTILIFKVFSVFYALVWVKIINNL